MFGGLSKGVVGLLLDRFTTHFSCLRLLLLANSSAKSKGKNSLFTSFRSWFGPLFNVALTTVRSSSFRDKSVSSIHQSSCERSEPLYVDRGQRRGYTCTYFKNLL